MSDPDHWERSERQNLWRFLVDTHDELNTAEPRVAELIRERPDDVVEHLVGMIWLLASICEQSHSPRHNAKWWVHHAARGHMVGQHIGHNENYLLVQPR